MTQPAISENRNTKLGSLIHGWSIAPGRQFSCPGESHLCRTRCYAKRGFFAMPNVKSSHLANFEYTKDDNFTQWLISLVRMRDIRIMRVHVAGDFYTPEYVQKWITIATALPRTTFFAYTRSWRVDGFMPELITLGSLPNFQMWWSIDRETGPAPVIKGIRRAYMAINDADASTAPNDCDLVFRSTTKTRMPKANGVTVCPVENGIDTRLPITCSKCGICWKAKKPRWETLFSPQLDLEIDNEIIYDPTDADTQTACLAVTTHVKE